MAEVDTPTSAPDTPASRPGRRGTILERLAQGVRDQSWSAVGLELVIVVVGVVIGFQATAWGEQLDDQRKEQFYLRQLSLDLAETERRADSIGALMAPSVHASRRLAQAHFLPEPPPRDSVVQWAHDALYFFEVTPVLGTAEALVATGDIGLIQDDSLRTAITAYVEGARETIRGSAAFVDLLIQVNDDVFRRAPMAIIFAELVGPAALDSLDRDGDWKAVAPPGVSLPALDTEAFVRDRELHGLMTVSTGAKGAGGLAYYREEIQRSTAALRERIVDHIER